MMPETQMAAPNVTDADRGLVILGEVITCNICQAYLDGFVRASKTGFCPVCGAHMPTMKKRQERKARLIRHYEDDGVM